MKIPANPLVTSTKTTPATLPTETTTPVTSATTTTTTTTTQTTQTTTSSSAHKLLDNTPSKRPVAEVPVDQRAGKTAGIHALKGGGKRDTFAAIDLGSSSAKMLVLQRSPSGWKTVVDMKIGCALGKDVGNGADIPAANQDRALDALKKMVATAAEHGVDVADIPMITTAVVRNAQNGGDFVKRVASDVGLRAKVLSGDEEADIGYRGALGDLLQTPGRYASLDLGGGSFQLAVGTHTGLEDGGSTQVGSNVILDTMINPKANPHPENGGQVDAALFAHVDAELDRLAPMPLDTALLAGRTLVATGGVSKFLRIQLGADVVSRGDIDALRRQLGAMSVAERSAFVQLNKTPEQLEALGIGTRPGADDYGKKLPASMSLLLHILDGIGVDQVKVSSSDARHALIFSDPRAQERSA